jgi:DNA-binding transcriptional ArsR family regulator
LKKAGLVEARQDGKWTHYRLKKLKAGLAGILDQTLDCLQNQPQIIDDLRRLKLINCNPSRFGVSSPVRVTPSVASKRANKPNKVKAWAP